MAPVRIMPCLDIKDGRVVKGVKFVELRDAGDPVEAAVAYAEGGADELAFLDITATVEGRRTTFDVLRRVTGAIRIPVTVGGGIKALRDIEDAVASGAAAVSISSAAYRNPDFVSEAVKTFGSAKIVVAVDVDANPSLPSRREVMIDGGRTPTGKDALEFAREMRDRGAGALLPTSKATDGVRTGYDLAITRAMADATGLPIIASGGAGELKHFLDAAVEGKAAVLLAASVFHFGVFSIREVKEYLSQHGVAVNLG